MDIQADIRDNGLRTPLHYACLYGQIPIIDYLINEELVDIDAKDSNGMIPFMLMLHPKLDTV